jgi:RNA polymerase sigma-70 factor (ECF subfamily)
MTDAELVNAARNGNPSAFSELAKRYYKPLTITLTGLLRDPDEARDVCQIAILKAYESLPGFRRSCSFKTWLYRIAINAAKDHMKKNKPLPASDSLDEIALCHEPSSYDKYEKNSRIVRIREAIDRLPEKQKIVVKLRIFEQMDYGEIGAITGSEPGAARANFFHAIKSLKKALEDEK